MHHDTHDHLRKAGGWSRREFLKGTGAILGLPFFPSLYPGRAWADEVKPPTRLMFMTVPLGFVLKRNGWDAAFNVGNEGWLPEGEGANLKLTAVNAELQPYLEHISFIRGLCNLKYRGNVHNADDAFLTCADTLADPSRVLSNTISCDQVAANAPGMRELRHPSLSLGSLPANTSRTGGLAWTAQGVGITPLQSPAVVFDRLFGTDELPAEERLRRLEEQRSILDGMIDQIGDMNGRLSPSDRQRMEEVLQTVRGVESEIAREGRWIGVAKPRIDLARPDPAIGVRTVRHAQAMFALAHAAFLTDSTRIITYQLPDVFSEISPQAKHSLNHAWALHTAQEAIRLDQAYAHELAAFLKLLCDTKEQDGQPMIHHLAAAYGSGMWGISHGLRDLPMILIGHGGGNLAQGQIRRYPGAGPADDGAPDSAATAVPTPLANLWLTMLTAAGVPAKSFADSTGTLEGLLA